MLCSVYQCKYWNPRCEGVFCNCNEIFENDAYFPLDKLEKGLSFRKTLAYRFLRSPICLELDSYLTDHPETKEQVMDFLYNVEGHGNSLKRQFIKQFPELNRFLRRLRPRPIPRNSIENDISNEVLKQGVDEENTDMREWQPLSHQPFQSPNKYDVDSDQNLDRIVDLIQCINNKEDLLRTFDKLKESNEQPLYDHITAYFASHGLTLPDGTEILKPTRDPQKISDVLENDGVVNAIKQKMRLDKERPSNFEDEFFPSGQSNIQYPISSLEESDVERQLNQPTENYYRPFETVPSNHPPGSESVLPFSNTYDQPAINNFTPFTENNASPNVNTASSNAYNQPDTYSNSYYDPLLDQDNAPFMPNPTSAINEKLYQVNDQKILPTPTNIDSQLLLRPNNDDESESDTEPGSVNYEHPGIIDDFNSSFDGILSGFGTNTDDENETKLSHESLANSQMPFENLINGLKNVERPITEIQPPKISDQQYIPSVFNDKPRVTENKEFSEPSSNDIYSGKTLSPVVFDDLVPFESNECTPSETDQSVGEFISSDDNHSATPHPSNSPTLNANIEPIETINFEKPSIENEEAEDSENPSLLRPNNEDFKMEENDFQPVIESVKIEQNVGVEQQPIPKSDDENYSLPKIDEQNFDKIFTDFPGSDSIDTADSSPIDSKEQLPTDTADKIQPDNNFSFTEPMKHSFPNLDGGKKSTTSDSSPSLGSDDSQMRDNTLPILDETDLPDPNIIEKKPATDSLDLNVVDYKPKSSNLLDITASPHKTPKDYSTDENDKSENHSSEIVAPKPQDENNATKEPSIQNDSGKNSSNLIDNDDTPITNDSMLDQFDNLFDDILQIPERENSKNQSNEDWESIFQNSNPQNDDSRGVVPQDTNAGGNHQSPTNTDLSHVSIKPELNADNKKYNENYDIKFESGENSSAGKIENFEDEPSINNLFLGDNENTSSESTPNDTHSKHDPLTDNNSTLDENTFSGDKFFADIHPTPMMQESEPVINWDDFDFGESTDIDSLFNTMKDSWFEDDKNDGFFSDNGLNVTPTKLDHNKSKSTDDTPKISSPIDDGLENEWGDISTPIMKPSNLSDDFNLGSSEFASLFDENDEPTKSPLLSGSSDRGDNFNDVTASNDLAFPSQQQSFHRGVPNVLQEKLNKSRSTLSGSNASPSSIPKRNLPGVPDIIRSKFDNRKSSVS